jgi:hypothetical protein
MKSRLARTVVAALPLALYPTHAACGQDTDTTKSTVKKAKSKKTKAPKRGEEGGPTKKT